MKSKAKIISILLIAQMILASLSFSVYAAGSEAQSEAQSNEQTELASEGADAAESAVTEEAQPDDQTAGANAVLEGTEEKTESITIDESAVAKPLVKVDDTTATVSWEDGLDVTEVTEYVFGEDWVKADSKMITTETSVEFSGLEAGKKYGFTVATLDGESEMVEAAVIESLAMPKGFRAFPSYQSVFLVWEPVAGADAYEVYRGSKLFKTIKASKLENRTASDGTDYLIWFDKDNKKDKKYKYKIKAVSGNAESDFTAVKSASRIRTAYYKCTFKASVRLYSHDKAKKGVTFKRGQTITAEGYGTGAYEFTYKGRPYEAKWFRMSKTKSDYSKNAYDKKYHGDYIVAENYVNRSNGGKSYSSKTGNLTWISLYSQRIFVFKGKKGKWELIKSWQCNTGKASSPTPTGFKKDIWKTFTRHSAHKYWSCFSSYNAIHGRNSNDAALGKPVSNGCVRTNNDDAQWFMKLNNKKLHAKVLSW